MATTTGFDAPEQRLLQHQRSDAGVLHDRHDWVGQCDHHRSHVSGNSPERRRELWPLLWPLLETIAIRFKSMVRFLMLRYQINRRTNRSLIRGRHDLAGAAQIRLILDK